MSFRIDRGLFLFDFIDHHAILGVSVDAEVKDIQKRYHKVVQRLHPDRCRSESEENKEQANQLLSKLVNPAWEKLSQERERNEYELLLKLKGQQAIRRQNSLELHSNLAKQLLLASNPDHAYRTSLKGLAEKQYEQLDQSLEITAQISELNLAYVMRKESQGELSLAEPKKVLFTGSNLPDSSQSNTRPVTPTVTPATKPPSIVDDYYRRAEGFLSKGNLTQSIVELRDALKIEPKNSRCHSLLGTIYIRQNQPTMARIHFNKALETDPQDERALAGKQKLEQAQQKTASASTAGGGKAASQKGTPKADGKSGKPDNQSGGGLFGLFGKKK